MPTFSVIMNCHNGERYLREAIDSVYAQTYQDWDIVLWDDASTDATEHIARGYDEKLRYFKGAKAAGLGQARNFALAEAKGTLLAFLDQDDLWLPSKLEKQVGLFDDPEVGLGYSDSFIFNESGNTSRLGTLQKYHVGRCFPQLLANYFLAIETVVIRRSALDTLDMWFEPGFNMCEEADLFLRIAYHWKLAMIDEPLAKWRVHSSSWTWKSNERAVEERELILAKYHKLFPDFAARYAEEIRVFNESNLISKAKNLWKADASQAARRCLAPLVIRNRKALALFCLTHFPPRWVFYAMTKLGRNVYPA